jgi:hypothetical protein
MRGLTHCLVDKHYADDICVLDNWGLTYLDASWA